MTPAATGAQPPDVVIGGAYRSGTTTLRHLLAQHPALFFPRLVEPSYFAFDNGEPPTHLRTGDDDPFHRRRTQQWHEYERLYTGAAPGQLCCDCSPEYLRAPGSFDRLATARSDVRVILTLRHPVDRLVSDWQMCRRDGVEPLRLHDALAAIDERNETASFGGHYVATSRYSAQLTELFAAIPHQQVLTLIHEEWIQDLPGTAQQVTEFLDIEPFPQRVALTDVHNRSGEPPNAAVARVFALRRRLAPILGGRIPLRVQRPIDRFLQGSLVRSVPGDELAAANQLLAGEVEAVEEALGRPIPLWRR